MTNEVGLLTRVNAAGHGVRQVALSTNPLARPVGLNTDIDPTTGHRVERISFVDPQNMGAATVSSSKRTAQAPVTNWGIEVVRLVGSSLYGGVVNAMGPVAHWRLGEGKAYASVVAGTAPVSHWRLGEASGTVATDAMGANNGTYVGSPTLSVAGALAGDANTAVTFDGVNDYINVPLGSPAGTIGFAIWVKSTVGSGRPIGAFGPTYGWMLEPWSTGYRLVPLTSAGNNAGATVHVGSNSDGVWHFYAGSITSTTASLSVDGGVSVTAAVSGWNNVNLDLTIGVLISFFNGSIDEVALWDRALTATEVATLYAEGSRLMAVDISGNAQHGTYVASPTLGVAGALAGDPDTAVTFNGTSQYVSMGTLVNTDTTTWSCWFKKASDGSIRRLMGVGGAGGFVVDTTTGNKFSVEMYGAGVLYRTVETVTGTGWHNFTVTKDGTVTACYIDGVATTKESGSNATLSGSSSVLLSSSFGPYTWDGSLDEFAIWNRALTADEVAALYTAGI